MNLTFQYTREALTVIKEDFKKYCNIFKYGSLIFTTLYFIYALVTKTGNFVANIILASLFAIYTIFELSTIKFTKIKSLKTKIRRSYKWSTLTIKAFTLGSLLYGIYTATTKVSAMATIIATLMVILWVFQFLLEIIIEIIENKIDLLSSAFQQDIADVKDTFAAPVDFVKNGFKRLIGKEVEVKEEPKKSKKIQMLYDRIEEKKEAKKEAKHKTIDIEN